jgi:hypothetical protein
LNVFDLPLLPSPLKHNLNKRAVHALLHAGVAEVKLDELLTGASAETLTLVAEMMDPINREPFNSTNPDHFILTEQAQVLLIDPLPSQ